MKVFKNSIHLDKKNLKDRKNDSICFVDVRYEKRKRELQSLLLGKSGIAVCMCVRVCKE